MLKKNNTENLSLDEKVDLLLKNQQKLKHFAWARLALSFLIFFAVVILPIIGIYWIGGYITDVIGLTGEEIGETLRKVKSLTEFDSIKGIFN